MFDFIGTALVKTGALIGGFFLSVGVFLGGTPSVQNTISTSTNQIVDVGAQNIGEQEVRQINSPPSSASGKSSQTSVDTSSNIQVSAPKSQAPVSLQINDVQIRVNEDETVISWETTMAARSRLTTNGIVYESRNGVGTIHSVVLSTEIGKEYNYYISAQTLDTSDLEDDVYGSFAALTERSAFFGSSKDDCQTFIIREASGKLSVGTQISVRSINKGPKATSYHPYVMETTNSNGEIKYCYDGTISKYEIKSGDNSIDIIGQ